MSDFGLHTLKPAPGSRKPRKRVGRGEGSGMGKTAGRGENGYGSRSGAKDRARFEGGQMPIHMRMRKLRGPNKKQSMPFEPFRTHTQTVNLKDLEERFDKGAEVTLEALREQGPGQAQGHPGEDPRQGRGHQAADGPRAQVQRYRSRGHRGRRRDLHRGRVTSVDRCWRRSSAPSGFTDIRKKLAFTALLLGLYRLGSHIPVPGVDVQAVNAVQKQFGGGGVLNLLNTFSGGGLSRIALFALGIMPYITASIILQLLVVVVPSLEKLQKEGEVGQARITQYTRYLTVGLAFAQSIGYVFLFKSFGQSAGSDSPIIPKFDTPARVHDRHLADRRARSCSCGWASSSPSAASATGSR